MSRYKERILPFGDSQHLLGILTEPAQPQPQKPVILFLNAGVVHHIGPFRMSTDFARTLTADGFSSFRLDLSGIGDSHLGHSQASAEQRFVDDVKAAMNLLQAQLGAQTRFLILGLCTGADNAHKVAARDERICGAIFLDGYAYPTPKFYWFRYSPILLSPKRLLGVLLRLFKKPQATADGGTKEDAIFTWSLPDKEKTVGEWTRMLNNGMQMLFVYTGGVLNMLNYEQQPFDAVPVLNAQRDKVSVKFFREADHTYTLAQDRSQLLIILRDWLKRF